MYYLYASDTVESGLNKAHQIIIETKDSMFVYRKIDL